MDFSIQNWFEMKQWAPCLETEPGQACRTAGDRQQMTPESCTGAQGAERKLLMASDEHGRDNNEVNALSFTQKHLQECIIPASQWAIIRS